MSCDPPLVLPALSVAVAVKLWAPTASAPVVKFQAPEPFAVAVPTWVAPSNTFTALFASAVPFTVTWFELTIVLLVMTGALGATVSIVTLSAAEAALVVEDVLVVVVVVGCWSRPAGGKNGLPFRSTLPL